MITNLALSRKVFLISLNVILFIFYYLISLTLPVEAQQYLSFRDPQGRFTIRYPNSMVRQYHTNPSVVFFAKMRDYRFPSLTITQHNSYYTPRSSSAHIQGILTSYRNVGFLDVKAVDTSEESFLYMPKQKNSVIIGYTLNGYKHLAEVTYVSAQNMHFIITYVDTEVNFTRNALMRDNTVKSFDITRSLLGLNTAANNTGYVGNLGYSRSLIGNNYLGSGGYSSYNQYLNRLTSGWLSSSSTPLLYPLILVVIIIFGASTIFKK
jgi:hypothetical protein